MATTLLVINKKQGQKSLRESKIHKNNNILQINPKKKKAFLILEILWTF